MDTNTTKKATKATKITKSDVDAYKKACAAITLASIRGCDLRLVNRDPSGFAPVRR
jgi:hypothetical protein